MNTPRKLKDCPPGERIRMAHVDDVLIVLEAGEGLEQWANPSLLIPVASTETWKVCLEFADAHVFPENDDA